MFMQRLISLLILIPCVSLLIGYGPEWLIMSFMFLIVLAAGYECWQLIPLQQRVIKIGFLITLACYFIICDYLFSYWLVIGMLFWGLNVIAIITFPKSQAYWGNAPFIALACLLLLPLFAQSMLRLYYMPEGKALILYLLCLVWAADIGAYLAGKCWGRHKLIPNVSPGKSWEGALGGLAFVFIIASLSLIHFQPFSFVSWFTLALLIAVISIFGDLLVSMLKRRCHLKDTGALIPGHGGVLDRLDSLIAAAPFFYFGIHSLSWSL